MDFSLWSRAAVGPLIDQEFGIKLQVRSIGKCLTRWGFTPQKPIKRAYEQSPEAVQNRRMGEGRIDVLVWARDQTDGRAVVAAARRDGVDLTRT